jgi:hypothetical protein
MGHLWLGFEPAETTRWLRGAGLTDIEVRPLPTDTEAKGPALFAAVAGKPAADPKKKAPGRRNTGGRRKRRK